MRATEQCKLSEDSIELGDPAVGTGEDVERTCPYIAVETGANYWEGAAHGTNRVPSARAQLGLGSIEMGGAATGAAPARPDCL